MEEFFNNKQFCNMLNNCHEKNRTLEIMKEDYINEIYLANDETHKKIIKDTMKNLEEIKLDINEIIDF